MEEFEIEYKLVELINKATKFRNNHDLDSFNNTIQEIDAVDYHRKYELIDFLFDIDFMIETFERSDKVISKRHITN